MKEILKKRTILLLLSAQRDNSVSSEALQNILVGAQTMRFVRTVLHMLQMV